MACEFVGNASIDANSLLDSQRLLGFLGREVKNILARKNRTKPLVRISFLGTRPLVFPPTAIRFSAETT